MRSKHYKFTVSDIARLGHAANYTVYRAIAVGRVDPHSLESVVKWSEQQKLIEAGSKRYARAMLKASAIAAKLRSRGQQQSGACQAKNIRAAKYEIYHRKVAEYYAGTREEYPKEPRI